MRPDTAASWKGIVTRYALRPYAFPKYTCFAMLHDVLEAELGMQSGYKKLAAVAGSEAQMARLAIQRWGSVEQGHIAMLGDCAAWRLCVETHRALRPRVAFVTKGDIYTSAGVHTVNSDAKGALLLCGPDKSDMFCGQWLLWDATGIIAAALDSNAAATYWTWS